MPKLILGSWTQEEEEALSEGEERVKVHGLTALHKTDNLLMEPSCSEEEELTLISQWQMGLWGRAGTRVADCKGSTSFSGN